jgi:hypothetical protein
VGQLAVAVEEVEEARVVVVSYVIQAWYLKAREGGNMRV